MIVAEVRAWTLAPFTVMGAFLAVGVGGMFAAAAINVWELPVSGFASAFAVVYVAKVAAPSHKEACALVFFLLGASVAWLLLKNSYWPESHPTLAYRPTLLPFWSTIAGGILALLLVVVQAHVRRRSTVHAI